MDERIQEVGRRIYERYQDDRDEERRAHNMEMQRRGFQSSAGITFRLIDGKLDAFKEQMKGPGLTKADQAAYAALDELKAEIETASDAFWKEVGADWRPIKPVVKGKVTFRRRSDDDDSEDRA